MHFVRCYRSSSIKADMLFFIHVHVVRWPIGESSSGSDGRWISIEHDPMGQVNLQVYTDIQDEKYHFPANIDPTTPQC